MPTGHGWSHAGLELHKDRQEDSELKAFFLLKLTVALSEIAVLFSSLQLCILEKFSVS